MSHKSRGLLPDSEKSRIFSEMTESSFWVRLCNAVALGKLPKELAMEIAKWHGQDLSVIMEKTCVAHEQLMLN